MLTTGTASTAACSTARIGHPLSHFHPTPQTSPRLQPAQNQRFLTPIAASASFAKRLQQPFDKWSDNESPSCKGTRAFAKVSLKSSWVILLPALTERTHSVSRSHKLGCHKIHYEKREHFPSTAYK